MLDNILIIMILFSLLITLVVSCLWKKRHFVKELYIGSGVSIVIYAITVTIIIGLLSIYFATSKGLQYSWLYLLIVLLFDWLLLFIFLIDYTTCVYIKDVMLYKKNIFITKKIPLNKEIIIIEKIDRTIIKNNNKTISISSRYLTGNIRIFIHKIKMIISY